MAELSWGPTSVGGEKTRSEQNTRRGRTAQSSRVGRPINVCIVIHKETCALEYGIAQSVFSSSADGAQSGFKSWYLIHKVEISEAANSDFSILVDADIIIVPGWEGVLDFVPSDLSLALRTASENGARMASMGTGVFALAHSGVLEGKRVTTHWRYLVDLQSRYARVKVDADVLFVEDGNVISSAGGVSALDMCVHMVRADYGATISNIVSRKMVMNETKDEARTRYVSSPLPRVYQGNIAPLLDKIRETISEDWGIERMALESRSSARTLQRKFKDATGHSPHMWLTVERIEFAKDLLETTSLHIQQIANVTGLKTPETFRHHFKRLTGISPTRFRSQFTGANDTANNMISDNIDLSGLNDVVSKAV